MNKIKNGDIVGRISYNKDIIFIVKDVRDKKNVILEGALVRIIADSDIKDLELINKKVLSQKEKMQEEQIQKQENRLYEKETTGKILHLDAESNIV